MKPNTANIVQGYFLINYKKMTDEEYDTFMQEMSSYTINFRLINSKNNKQLYHAILRDNNVIDSLVALLSYREVKVLGVWNIDGTEFGTTIETTYEDLDKDETKIIKKLVGIAKHPYKKVETESYLTDRVKCDEDGKVIKTLGKLHHSFSGFKKRSIL